MITEKNRATNIWVEKGAEVAGEIEKLCKAGGKQTCSTMSETKVAFAERTTPSLKIILYRYMDDYGYRYIHF